MLKIVLLTIALIVDIYADAPAVNDDDIKYSLYNSKASKVAMKCDDYGEDFDAKSDTKLLIHGWGEDMETFWYSSTRIAYVAKGFNVILVDWSQHAQTDYQVASTRASAVADVIGRFIIGLRKTYSLSMGNFHIIGHCIGAHVAGFTGKTLCVHLKEKVGRISGLDPAGVSFFGTKDSRRLAKQDAIDVDTVITDAGDLGFGLNCSIGHVNFFPNGGKSPQPGCKQYPCSHNRAAVYFHESIVSTQLVGKKCGSYEDYLSGMCKSSPINTLGDSTNFSVKGDFYLNTNTQSPFGMGDV